MAERRAISFSWWGNRAKDEAGLIRNAQLAPEFYPGWEIIVFMDEKRKALGIPALPPGSATTVFVTVPSPSFPDAAFISSLMWRFLAGSMREFSRVIFRDLDSRLSAREAAAVAEWVAGGQTLHTMRDHPAHMRTINGGMWGIVTGRMPHNLSRLMRTWYARFCHDHRSQHDPDQCFLHEVIWPIFRHDCCQHDSHSAAVFRGSRPFPTPRDGRRFVGEVWEADETPRDGDWQQIKT